MKDPLNQFAERLIRNGEVKEFVQGLIAMGVKPEDIVNATKPESETGLLNKEMYEGMVRPRHYAKHSYSRLP